MKICDRCGHRNYGIAYNEKKERICEKCVKTMSDCAQNLPMRGFNDGDGCYYKQKLPGSDEQC